MHIKTHINKIVTRIKLKKDLTLTLKYFVILMLFIFTIYCSVIYNDKIQSLFL